MRIIHTPRDQHRMHAFQLLQRRHTSLPMLLVLDYKPHRRLHTKRWLMIVAGGLEELVEYLAKGTLFFVGIGMCFVRFENEHADGVGAWDGGWGMLGM
jgi:hypothetical protein